MSVIRTAPMCELASFLAGLRYEDVPEAPVGRTKELFLDWVGSALAGRGERPVRIIARSRGLEKEKDVRDLLPAGPA